MLHFSNDDHGGCTRRCHDWPQPLRLCIYLITCTTVRESRNCPATPEGDILHGDLEFTRYVLYYLSMAGNRVVLAASGCIEKVLPTSTRTRRAQLELVRETAGVGVRPGAQLQ